MSGRTIAATLLCLALSALPLTARAQQDGAVDGGRFGPIHFSEPPADREIEGVVALISGKQGWDEAAETTARHLADQGQAVLGIDLARYLAALKQDSGPCSSVNTDLEELSRRVEKTLPFQEFHPPVILGLDAGANVAYAAVREVLPNTFAGGIGLDFSPNTDVGRKLCLPEASAPGQGASNETPFLFTPSIAFSVPKGGLKSFLTATPDAHPIQGTGDRPAAIDAALEQIFALRADQTSVTGLPIVEVPPPDSERARALVIFYSGDGGWRDIDRQIGSYLADQGFFVVGFDSLRYFWREKEPQEMAADLDMLIRHYQGLARDRGVVLVGYSFGADLLPFIVNRMEPETKQDVRLVSLLGISSHASFEIRLEGIMGVENIDGPATLPELSRLHGIPVQCIYGFDEDHTACTAKALDGVISRVAMNGGHHFDGDYHDIANAIVAAAKNVTGSRTGG